MASKDNLPKDDTRAEPTRIALVGYGNIGRATEMAVNENERVVGDMEIVGIITRRPNNLYEKRCEESGKKDVPIVSSSEPSKWKSLGIDVAILCGGSKSDLPVQGPVFASYFNTVDSFDTHDNIGPWIDEKGNYKLGHKKEMNNAAYANGNTSIISAGWDPGTFSLERVLQGAFIPGANPQEFYGLGEKGGLSMGHSDALRQLNEVQDARQYTHTRQEALERVRKGENPNLSRGETHWRECVVVPKEGVNKTELEKRIKDMPGYFRDFKTEVKFVSQEEMDRKYSEMPHDGLVLSVSPTENGNTRIIEYRNQWGSNPEGTAGILAACARAAHRLNMRGSHGAYGMFDIPPCDYSAKSRDTLFNEYT